MGRLAIIPARGGSKRIPRKNIRNFLGKPIIAYSIAAALDSNLFDQIMVSTDDEEIAEISLKLGAQVPFKRCQKNADDFATTFDVLREVIDQYKIQFNQQYEYACCIYPTAPLIQIEKLQEGFDLLVSKNYDSVFPVASFGYPVWRGLEIINDRVFSIWPEYKNARSQDLKKVYHDAGQWYWFRPGRITNTLFTDNSSCVVLDDLYVQDIDTLVDWSFAELKYKALHNFNYDL